MIEPDQQLIDDATRKRSMIALGVALFTLSVAVHVHMAMNVNFIDDVLGATPWQQGYLESIRESCGIVSFVIVALLVGFSEPRVAAVMILLTGVGLAAYSSITEIWHLIMLSLVWSLGFHAWAPISRSMQIALSRPGREGATQGTYGAVAAAGVLFALGSVYAVKTYTDLGMRELFLMAGILTAIGAVPLLFMHPIRAHRAGRLPVAKVIRPGYRLYCGLELLDGMRKQIFLLFAILTLVREYGTPVQTIALLMFINQLLGLVFAPIAGRLVDRFGERPVLSGYFFGVATLFLLYASVTHRYLLYSVFVVDNAMFAFRVGLPTYAGRVAAAGERTSLLAMGVTMNHVGAVTLPLVGGALYAAFGYEVPFYCGAGVAFVSLIIAQFMPGHRGETSGDEDAVPRRAVRIRLALLGCVLTVLTVSCFSLGTGVVTPTVVRPLDALPQEFEGGSLSRHGLQAVLTVAGTPEQMGRQHGTLCARGIRLMIDSYVLDRVIGSHRQDSARRAALVSAARNLRPHLPAWFVSELDACADAAGVDRDLLLIAQCEGDLRDAIARAGVPSAACSSFAAFGSRTATGDMVCGRNFDYYLGGDVAGHCSLVTFAHPSDGLSFAAIGITGVLGGPTLINERGLVVANHTWGGASAVDPSGIPTWILLRTLAQRAGSVDEAIELLTSMKRMRNQIIWVAQSADPASGRPPRAVALYYDAESVTVEEAGDEYLAVTNSESESCSRKTRIRRLIEQADGPISLENALTTARGVAAGHTFHVVHVDFGRRAFRVWQGATPAHRSSPETYALPGDAPPIPQD